MNQMKAMVLRRVGTPLVPTVMDMPVPGDSQVLLKVIACGICRTDLHIVDGELAHPKLPLIPGHEIIGMVIQVGKSVRSFAVGDIVGVPWLAYTCNECRYCKRHQENLCIHAMFTGYTMNGGYAEYTVAYEQYCFHMPAMYANGSGAPLLCAGFIGFRAWNMIRDNAENIGIYGFGAAAHILTQIAVFKKKNIYAFTKPGDILSQMFALDNGAKWAGDSTGKAPVQLDAAIIFATDGALIPLALLNLDKGGQLICGGIHMSNIPSFPYSHLWEERAIQSVANLTRQDGELLLQVAPQVPVKTTVQLYKLEEANEALSDLRSGKINGAAVLVL
ncbi:zinc-dependent alcohol dehydrogenase family protein [Chitinophaga sancti]|uniref:zinc-dependent alcohol dehydrogenase family protein n=1 Tax=Chitinophaga sancti TaxID=1004 RepID=UPI002A74C507|nr:zinc-dependent alcohol dehydrogenase family protein [Chitinophaga sancti]WPQ60462.1 zinc-dependent alcohol dehydrogenase family protein [Chitinophaga sancti]